MTVNHPVALTPAQQRFVGNRIIRFADVLNTTGLYSFLKEHEAFQEGKEALASVVSGLVESNLNARFHSGLNFFEKLGFLGDLKREQHGMRVAFGIGATDFVTRSLVDVIPMLVDHVHRNREFQKVADFYIAWLAYVNQQPTLAVQHRVRRLFESNEREYDHQRYVAVFQESAGKRPGLLPTVPSSMVEHPETLFVTMLGGCDLSDEAVLGRAKELGDYLGFAANEVDQQIAAIRENGAPTSTLTGFAGFSMDAMFSDLAANLAHAKEAAVYLVENDPHHHIREERKKLILGSAVGLGAAALTLVTGPVGDMVLAASAPLVLKVLSAAPSPLQVVEVNKRLLDLKTKLRIPREGEPK